MGEEGKEEKRLAHKGYLHCFEDILMMMASGFRRRVLNDGLPSTMILVSRSNTTYMANSSLLRVAHTNRNRTQYEIGQCWR